MNRLALLAPLVVAAVVACNANPTPPGSPPAAPPASPPPGPPAPPAPPPPAPGALQLLVSGLPDNTPASVTVQAPNGSSQAITTSSTLSDLPPGAYAINARDVVGIYNFKPQLSDQAVTVTAGATARATINYAATTGALEYKISGLLAGQKPQILMLEANSLQQVAVITESATLPNIAPGDYRFSLEGFSPSPNEVDTLVGFKYDAGIFTKFTVKTGETLQAKTVFTPITGSLELGIIGLPNGAQANVSLERGGNLPALSISRSGDVNYLSPGTHTLKVTDVVFKNFTYASKLVSLGQPIIAGQIAPVSIEYAPIDSQLEVEVSGLPADQKRVKVTGPGGFNSGLFDSSQSFAQLQPGAYTITAQPFTLAPGKPGCRTFTPNAASQQQNLTAGHSATVTLTYTSEPCGI